MRPPLRRNIPVFATLKIASAHGASLGKPVPCVPRRPSRTLTASRRLGRRQRDRAPLATADDGEKRALADALRIERALQVGERRDRRAVERDDDVAWTNAGTSRRSVRRDLEHTDAGGRRETKTTRELPSDRRGRAADAEESAAHAALTDERSRGPARSACGSCAS